MNSSVGSFGGLGVRGRTTLIATVVVGLVLAASSVLLLVATRSALFQSVETTVTARSLDVASQVDSGFAASPLPFVRGISVQIVAAGVVVSSTDDIAGQGPVVDPATLSPGVSIVEVPSLDVSENDGDSHGNDGDEGPFLISVTDATLNGRRATVLAAGSLLAVENATRTLVPLLALGIPLITLLVGLTVWRLTRRAFLPVEAMAAQADTISYSDLHLRVPESKPDDEIRRLAVVLNRMLERLETSVTRQRRFTADAGHELKSPIATLLTMAEVAEANPEAFEVGELATDVAGQSRRLATLVEDLLVLASADEHRLDVDRGPVDLAGVIREEITSTNRTSVTVEFSVRDAVWVHGDRRKLGQVVRNLLDNAAGHASDTVRIDAQITGDLVTFVVADDGPGIPIVDRERIFGRFVRLDEARSRDSGGTGLGLSVVRSIVQAHGGTVTASDDAQLGGAAVIVSLPVGRGSGDPER